MNSSRWIHIIGGLVILMATVELFTGVAVEKPGLVRRSERPGVYWFSVICKFVVGVAILNIEYLRTVLGH